MGYQLVEHTQVVSFSSANGPYQTMNVSIPAPVGMGWAGFFRLLYVDSSTDAPYNSEVEPVVDVQDDGETLVVRVRPQQFETSTEYSPKILVKAAAVSNS